MNTPIRSNNAPRRFIRAVAMARKGEPNATLRAYAVTRRPASGIGTLRSAETSGNNPIITNSVVPMPNVARASANKGRCLVGAWSSWNMGNAIISVAARWHPACRRASWPFES